MSENNALHAFASGLTARVKEPLSRAVARSRLLIGLTVVLFSAPACLDLLSNPMRAAYRWIAADTFYYLTVGRNFARHGQFTFDREHPSNGFQPLWQLCVSATEFMRERLGWPTLGPWLLTVTGMLLVAAGLWFMGLTLLRARRLSLLFLGMPVGLYALTVLPAWSVGLRTLRAHDNLGWLLPVFGTLWSYVNGMESALVLFFYSLALFVGSARPSTISARHGAYFGFTLAGLTLARLDHVFFAFALLFGYALIHVRQRSRSSRNTPRLRRVVHGLWSCQQPLVAGLVLACCLLPYLLNNQHTFGAYVPLSGVAKSTFPTFNTDNLERILELSRGTLGTGSDWWLPTAARQLQTVVPASFAGVYLVVRAFRPSRSPLSTLLAASAVGVLALGWYDFAFTHAGDQGYWYTPVSTLLPSLFLLSARPFRLRLRLVASVFACVALCSAVLVFFVRWHRHPTYNQDFRDLMLQSAPEARAHYGGKPPKVLEIDDGVVGYALDVPSHACFLALDPEGFRARKEGRLLELAWQRGFRHVASALYRPGDTSDETLRGWIGASLNQDMAEFTTHKDFESRDGRLLIVEIRQRSRP